jgi:hypothetical protein
MKIGQWRWVTMTRSTLLAREFVIELAFFIAAPNTEMKGSAIFSISRRRKDRRARQPSHLTEGATLLFPPSFLEKAASDAHTTPPQTTNQSYHDPCSTIAKTASVTPNNNTFQFISYQTS